MTHKISKRVFSADFKRKVLETSWKDKLSFKETAEPFNLDNLSLIAAWQKRYLDEGILWLHPKPKGRPSMKQKELIPPTKDQTIKSDKERIVNDTLRMYKNDDIRMYNSDCITDTIVEVITTCNTYTLLTVHLL